MSASPMARQACSHAQVIPTRKVLVSDPSQMPDAAFLSSTPGGTIYSTTPGGTRLIYDRTLLMTLKNSPLSRTPPKNIPQGLLKGQPHIAIGRKSSPVSRSPPKDENNREELFDMDL